MIASLRRLLGVLAVPILLVGCSTEPEVNADLSATRSTVTVVRTLEHDRSAFTQGLVIDDGELYEGTGRKGSSYVRVSSLDTGEELRRVNLSAEYFGEGVAIAGDTVWQITWQNGIAFARDKSTLAGEREVDYDGEGWGLCAAAGGLVMSDGSSILTFRDADTFEATGTVQVTLDGSPLESLNELECAEDGSVYANLWRTFDIAKIDAATGTVTEIIDAEPLWNSMSERERDGADVLNGIAQIPGTNRFLVTGKLWPSMFEVEFTPVE